jgi:hypothetical protein
MSNPLRRSEYKVKTIQQPTTVVAILPLLLVLTATRAVNNATVLPGVNTAQVIHRYLIQVK